jgi:hypothetical protein
MSIKESFNKENIDIFLSKLAEEYNQINTEKKPVILTFVGGASILLNYNFRSTTGDIDVFDIVSSSIKEAIKNTAIKLNIKYNWLNDDIKKTNSYSEKLNKISVFNRNISNVLEIRTINSEYLVAMKLMAGRKYKHDFSDIAGIFLEHEKNGNSLKKENIDNAVNILYGGWEKIPQFSIKYINKVYETKDFEKLFNDTKNSEDEARRQYKKLEIKSNRDMIINDNDILIKKLDKIIERKNLFNSIDKNDKIVYDKITTLRKNIIPLVCTKIDVVKNKTFDVLISSAKGLKIENYGDFLTSDNVINNLRKLSYINNKGNKIFALEIKKGNINNYECTLFHLDKDFNKISAEIFINQYNKSQKNKNNRSSKNCQIEGRSSNSRK